jgi:predicted O-methyltransferase YrrM
LNTSAKIHSLKHYILYAYRSKTKYKIHSPFVFDFIRDILESSNRSFPKLPSDLRNYYIKYNQKIDIEMNAGEGSLVLNDKPTSTKSLITTIGIPQKYGKILYKLTEKYKCRNIIELGTSFGISTSYLAANKDCKVQSIDANKQIQDIAKEAFQKLKTSNTVFISARFDEVLKDLCSQSNEISLIFIDGDHNKDATIRYFNTCLPYLHENTIMVFDDIYWSKGMTEAWNHICNQKEVSLSIDLYRLGILFFRKEQKQKEHFILWH